MSTSVRNLSFGQMIFKRPAIAMGLIGILAMIIVNPNYNTVAVLFAIPLYWILYQNRRHIYSLGLGRFDFLAFLFYGSFLLSAVFKWGFENNGASSHLHEIVISSLFTSPEYQTQVKNWLFNNLNDLIHWKMVVFSPAIAAVLYLIFVEFDRKTVKEADLQSLGLTTKDLYKRGDIFEILGGMVFIIVSAFYGVQYLLSALLIIVAMAFLPVMSFMIFAFIFSSTILVLNFAYFNYVIFLSLPTIFTDALGSGHGLLYVAKTFKEVGELENLGQWYILVPYMTIMWIIGLVYIKNRAKVEEMQQEEAKAQEIATTADAILKTNDFKKLTNV